MQLFFDIFRSLPDLIHYKLEMSFNLCWFWASQLDGSQHISSESQTRKWHMHNSYVTTKVKSWR